MKKISALITCALFISISVFAQSWTGLGVNSPVLNQKDNVIDAVCADKYGNVYAVGMIYDSVWNKIVCKWNGSSWAALGTSSPFLDSFSEIYQVIADTIGNIYIAGSYTGSVPNNVLKWDGATWSKVGALNANGPIVTICFDRHYNLYAAGAFSDSTGCFVAKWDGTSWSELGTGSAALNANAKINCLYIDSLDNVFALGAFTDSAIFIGGNLYVAKWDGTTWSELGAGIVHQDISYTTQLYSIVGDAAGNIYVIGSFSTDSGYNCVTKWDGTAWNYLGGGTRPVYSNGRLGSLYMDKSDNLYVAGYYYGMPYSLSAAYVAKWDGSVWSQVGNVFPGKIYSAGVSSLCTDADGNMYAAGYICDTSITLNDSFHSYNPVYVAKYSLTSTTVLTPAVADDISIYPNPVDDILTINDSKITRGSVLQYHLYDMLGREQLQGIYNSDNLQINVSALSSGTYLLRIVDSDKVFKVIKE